MNGSPEERHGDTVRDGPVEKNKALHQMFTAASGLGAIVVYHTVAVSIVGSMLGRWRNKGYMELGEEFALKASTHHDRSCSAYACWWVALGCHTGLSRPLNATLQLQSERNDAEGIKHHTAGSACEEGWCLAVMGKYNSTNW